MSIMGAINDRRIFGKHFEEDPGSWHAWFTFLRALFGEPMDEDDLATFRQCTGRQGLAGHTSKLFFAADAVAASPTSWL